MLGELAPADMPQGMTLTKMNVWNQNRWGLSDMCV